MDIEILYLLSDHPESRVKGVTFQKVLVVECWRSFEIVMSAKRLAEYTLDTILAFFYKIF